MATNSKKYSLVEGWEKQTTLQLRDLRFYLNMRLVSERNSHHFINIADLVHKVREELKRRRAAGDLAAQ